MLLSREAIKCSRPTTENYLSEGWRVKRPDFELVLVLTLLSNGHIFLLTSSITHLSTSVIEYLLNCSTLYIENTIKEKN